MKLFGTGHELFEAGRHRRSVQRFDPFAGPFLMFLSCDDHWLFMIYRHDLSETRLPADESGLLNNAALGLCLQAEETMVTFAPLLERYPESPAVQLVHGQGLDYQCRFEEALESLRVARQLAPSDPAIDAALRQCQQRIRDFDEFLTYPRILIPDRPQMTQELLKRARVLRQQGQTAACDKILDAVEENCEDPKLVKLCSLIRMASTFSDLWLKAAPAKPITTAPSERPDAKMLEKAVSEKVAGEKAASETDEENNDPDDRVAKLKRIQAKLAILKQLRDKT